MFSILPSCLLGHCSNVPSFRAEGKLLLKSYSSFPCCVCTKLQLQLLKYPEFTMGDVMLWWFTTAPWKPGAVPGKQWVTERLCKCRLAGMSRLPSWSLTEGRIFLESQYYVNTSDMQPSQVSCVLPKYIKECSSFSYWLWRSIHTAVTQENYVLSTKVFYMAIWYQTWSDYQPKVFKQVFFWQKLWHQIISSTLSSCHTIWLFPRLPNYNVCFSS